jgi:hypothetical protein
LWFLQRKGKQGHLHAADAVVHPLAVVVKAFNALVTDEAVPRVWRADYLTGRAEGARVQFLY